MHLRQLIATCLVVLASADAEPKDFQRMNLGPSDQSKEDGVLKFQSHQTSLELEKEWQSFKTTYDKTYSDDTEETSRRQIFAENLKEIESHNNRYSKGLETFTLGINEFSDLESEEFLQQMTCHLGLNMSETNEGSTFMSPEVDYTLPDEVDWRNKGFVTPVKNQKNCGSCWAFSATGALEGQNFRKTGKLVSLSEQNLVDCSTAYGNHGCDGGLPFKAFEYVRNNRGIDSEVSYPYEAKDGKCRFNRSTVGATCTGFDRITRGSEPKLQQAVSTVGPISVTINVRCSFRHYRSGVYNDPRCNTTNKFHAVLVVGYGRCDEADYWIVKNSWGPSWGMNGYIWMSRNQDNQCGIATQATYPLV